LWHSIRLQDFSSASVKAQKDKKWFVVHEKAQKSARITVLELSCRLTRTLGRESYRLCVAQKAYTTLDQASSRKDNSTLIR
jgi:hypothetical protein